MKCFSLKGALLYAIPILLIVSCRKQDDMLSSNSQKMLNAKAAGAVHPLDDPTSLIVSVFYDDSGPGYVDVSWTGEMGGTYKVTVGSQTIIAYGNNATIQKHYNTGSTISATVATLDGSKTGTGSFYYDANHTPPSSLVYDPLPSLFNMQITSNLGGCTITFTWTPPNIGNTAYFYLELSSPDPPGPDGFWINHITDQCLTSAASKTIHINRYYYNDPVINARLVIQNVPYSTLPPPYSVFNDGRLNFFFRLPSTSYSYNGTLNQFYQNF